MRNLGSLFAGAALAAGFLVSCASAPPPAPAAEAETVPKASAPMLITDFEDATQPVSTFVGPKSQIKTEYESDVVHGGSSALRVTERTSDWSGALLELNADKGNWAAYSKLHLWIYGSKNGQYFNIDLEDHGLEQFRYTIANDFEGWKEFVIPFSSVPVRSDYQAPNAVRNGHIDWPLKTLQFCTAANFTGTLVFDDFSVDP